MKRILALIFAMVMVISCVACSSSPEAVDTATEAAGKTGGNKKEETKADEIVYPEGFSAGFARVDITPKDPLPIYDATATTAKDSLMLTCTAVCDGENVALLMSADLKGIQRSVAQQSFKVIEKNFGIPEELVMISATHTHSAPTVGGSSTAMARWLSLYYRQLTAVVKEALKDLTCAEAYTGVSHTDGITFVRRYLLRDGTYKTNPDVDVHKPIEHESEADNELRTIRFQREGKKDILMMNYQTHYGLYVEQYSADFVHNLRQLSEKEMDVNFVYYSGASGNLNFSGKLPGEQKYPDRTDGVKHMWEVAKEAIAGEKKVNVGKVHGETNLYDAKVLQDSDERIRQAKEIDALPAESPKRTELMEKYNFSGQRWVQGVITRSSLGETQAIPFSAISFGEIAFTSSPIEQFDANAKQVRDASPFKMTFTLSLTNGSYGYVPTEEAFPHGGYEVAVSRYTPGSGEEFAREQLRLLNLCYNAR